MDYTTLPIVKEMLHNDTTVTVDDNLLSRYITAASRAWDRKCTGTRDPSSDNYFELADVAGENLEGQISYDGKVCCYPHKPLINTIASFAFRKNITTTLYTVDPTRIEVMGNKVIAYPSSIPLEYPSKCRVAISYNGGFETSGSLMPAEMIDAVSILTIRFYREAESGLTDQIGVAELATMIYTIAWPRRVTDLLELYVRRCGWYHYG